MYSLIERLSQELSSQVKLATAGNASAPIDASSTPQLPALGAASFPELAMLWKFVPFLAGDWIKLFLLGTVLETIRRFTGQIWTSLIDSFFLTATFESDDDAHNWMMVWISRQPRFHQARDVQVSTKVRSPACSRKHGVSIFSGMGYQYTRLLFSRHLCAWRGGCRTREETSPFPSFLWS
ncbi:hypothetical protein M408DRAFT_93143 [Serendipita vermifera MAFF 305830]|uniref:BCS1 N-terminal domain-containing protein n=1 Tax=Serendipita vermifera MAFF 305830 TaxID=933852 RepID=A0A0C2XZH7_SERVB|nr:hypothetical protein M408DRAFT_93143 [Serendipita vermifera MAFF 305830]